MAENQGIIDAIKQGNKEAGKVLKDEIADGLKPAFNTLLEPLSSIKSGIMMLPGVGLTTKLFSAVTKPLKDSFSADQNTSAKEQLAANQAERDAEKERVLFEDIRDGIFAMRDGLLGMLKTAVDNPIAGILAGIGMAAFTLIGSFFAQLAREVKFLDKLLKGGLSKAFNPIRNFFNSLGSKFKATGLGKTIDGFIDTVRNLFKIGDIKGFKKLSMFEDLQKTFGRATRPIISIIDGIKSFGTNVKNIFGSIKTGLASMKGFMAGFKPIMAFARTVGTTLGKIFLPITFLISIFDFVTGFMDGYKSEGVFGGIRDGLAKVITGLIGLPLDLLKKGVAWVLKTFGFEETAKTLESFSFSEIITDLVRFPFNMLKKAVAWIGTLFTDPVEALSQLWQGIVGDGGLIDILFKPIDMAISWVKGLFGFKEPEGEEFSIAKIVKDSLKSIVDFFKSLLDIDVKGVLKSIPGGEFLLGLFEDDTLAEQIADKEAEIAKRQKDVDTDSFYEGEAQRKMDRENLLKAQQELADLKAQQAAGGGTTVVNNYNSSASSNSTTVTTQSLQDAAVATGSTMN